MRRDMPQQLIDVWNIRTFDPALSAILEAQADLLQGYFSTDQKIFLEYDYSRNPRRPLLKPGNPFSAAFHDFEEAVGREMMTRTIRAFHYTRMTDEEVAGLQRDGIHLSTPATLRKRLDSLAVAGRLSRSIADTLYAESPFHSDQLESRSDKFWMVSHPVVVTDSGVRPLMAHWGGEVSSMWMRDRAITNPLTSIGKPRIVEVVVPLSNTRHEHRAAKAVVATFARSRGSIPEKHAFDLYVKDPLPSSAIRAVHTEGDATFAEMGRGSPAEFVDVDVGRWKELTGEEC